jgi:hypothetical protein
MSKIYILCVFIVVGIAAIQFDLPAQEAKKQIKKVKIAKIKTANKEVVPIKVEDKKKSSVKKTKKKKSSVHFVDKDGDGINDNRCSGMGVGSKKRHGKKIDIDSVQKLIDDKQKRKKR